MALSPAQEPAAESEASAKLAIALDARGKASVSLRVFEHHLSAPLTPAVGQLLGCPLENVNDQESDGDWVFSARCPHAFRKRGLLVGGTLNFAPLAEALRQAHVEHAEVTIRHPRTGFSRFTDNGWSLETTAQSVEYTKNLALDRTPAAVHLAFGYRIWNFLPLTLLLFPIAISMVMRWAALRAKHTDPVAIWFTYWRLFGWVITGAWLLWVQGSTVIDCNALARFLLNDSPKAPLLQVAFYVVPPILVQLICTVASGAVLARVSGEQWILPVTLKHAFWHEPVAILPLLCLLAGVASLTLFNEIVLGLACLGIGYASQIALIWLWMRFQGFERYVLPSGDLRAHILELAERAGLEIKEIYLLPAAEGRLAGPLMIRRQRLFLSDALLRELRPRELDAVVAREFAHDMHNHRSILLAVAVLSLPLIFRFAHLPLIAAKLPWAVRGPLLVWITPVLLYMIWRYFERVGERETVAITGHPDAMVAAIPKLAQFNLLGLYWKRFEQRFFPNGARCDWRRQPLEGSPATGD